jgi:outer membrane autotransporter protein
MMLICDRRPKSWPARAQAWVLLAPLALAVHPLARATTPVISDRTITAATPVDDYLVLEGIHLTANGATMNHIRTERNATVTINGGTIDAFNSEDGIELAAGSSAAVSNNARIVADNYGIRLITSGGIGSSAQVTDSYVEGRNGAALISSNSSLTATNSTLVGTGTSPAVSLAGSGTLFAEGSIITGASAGLRMYGDNTGGAAEVTLLGTQVEGLTGPALLVGLTAAVPTTANILVGAGSSLVGGDGVLMKVTANSTANLRVNDSTLTGDVVADAGSTANLTLENQASLTGRLVNVASLTLNSQGSWTMTEDSQVGALAMNDGVVRFGAPTEYLRLELDTLSGNGTFVMDADFSTGQTDFLEIGTATGNHGLVVASSGNEPSEQNPLHLIHAAAGDASFSLVNGPVAIGAFSYELVQRGDDWFLDGSRQIISPGTASALALFNSAPTVWYGELSTLRSRMGELRLDERKSGAWVRSYGNKFNASPASGAAYSQVQQGFSLGVDAPLPYGDGQWLVGVMAGHSNSDLSVARGASGEVKSYYLGLYATWLDADSGYYFDGVAKVNRFDNSSKVELGDGTRTGGDYRNHGLGASLEFGRNIPLGDGYFIEPYTQWSAVDIQGASYRLDNGLRVDGDNTRSLLGKAGATFGRNFELGNGQTVQPYVRAAFAHEFAANNSAKVNDHRFSDDISGSRGELGVGVALALAERWQVHADFDYSNGERIEQPWGASVGLHYSW